MPHLDENSVVCILQNGLPEPKLAAILGEKRVVGCTVGWGATWQAPGISELTSSTDIMSFDLPKNLWSSQKA